MNNILFSIIVPVYNTKFEYLSRAVASCLQQTNANFELILVDDGSEFEYARKMDTLLERDKRIHVIHKTNEGVSVARNTGVDNAQGEYVLFLDADDYFEPNTLDILTDQIAKEQKPDVIVFSLAREYQDSSVSILPMYENGKVFASEQENQQLQTDVLKAPLDINILVFPYCKCIKRVLLANMQPCFPAGIAMCEDVVFAVKLFAHTKKVVYIDTVLYHYRQLWDSAVNKYREKADDEQRMLLQEIRAIVESSQNPLLITGYYYEVFYAMQRIIMMKYFHPSAPDGVIERRIKCGKVLSEKPYNDVFRYIDTKNMSRNQRIKAFLLKHHLYACMGYLRYIYFKLPGKRQI